MRDKKNTKFIQIINTANELFRRYGMRRISVKEICQKAEVSKMTFYKHFAHKKDLIKYILNDMFSSNIEIFNNLIASEIPFPRKIENTIRLKIEWNKTYSGEFFQDLLFNPDSDILQLIHERRIESLEIVMKFLKDAQQKGDIRLDIRLEFILYILNKMYDMAKDEQLTHLYSDHTDLIAELTNFFFYGILPRKNVQ
jgi:AcrR family transcriptional regulator